MPGLKTYVIDDVKFYVNSELPEDEVAAYVKRGKEKYGKYLVSIEATVFGDEIGLSYQLSRVPKFERIRRITGYLVGTLDRFNDAKRAEEADRVKHSF